ncbi:MAG TPA: YegS/Rv2252/BmrU family lipid kinase [Nocardioidaceae bacterium]|nr:YegS/Rv2252/BmrU family lipid kinase [Nocardioidaceae bacterium]
MARELVLLTNPSAGKGKGSRSAAIAVPRLVEAGFHVRHLSGRDAGDALEIARTCVTEGVEILVVCGGDGMVNIAVQAVANTETNLGIIPAGTGNDVARYLDIPRNDPQRAADVIVGSHVRTIDLARVGAKYFVTVLASGFDSKVNERANSLLWPKGQWRYNLATLAELRVFKPLPYTLEMDGGLRHLDAMLVAVGNGPSFGGGLRITHGARIDDGWLDVVVIKPMSKLELVRTYPKLYAGKHVHHPQYEHHLVRSITVAAPGIVAYADGERLGALPLTVDVAPSALRVLAPR